MRIKVLLSDSKELLPINNQHIVNSYIHRVLGMENEYHDAKNDYSISNLRGGALVNGSDKISFENGGYIIISSLNSEFINNILIKIYSTEFYKDIKIKGVEFIEETFYNGWNHFVTLSPFIIKKYEDKKKYTFLTVNDNDFEDKIREYLIKKLNKIDPKINLGDDFKIEIKNIEKAKIKKIIVKNVKNVANHCYISIFCSKDVAELLYNIGIGQSTGCGFGTIYKTENHDIYL